MAVSEAARLNEEILAVTTVHGNVPLDLTTKNAAKVLDVLPVVTKHFDARRIPIYRGCASPLIQSAHEYFPWHGCVFGKPYLTSFFVPTTTRNTNTQPTRIHTPTVPTA